MAQISQKITTFPGRPESYPPIAPIPPNLLTDESDPTHEIRNLVEELRGTACVARKEQLAAEEEGAKLRLRLAEAEAESSSSRATDPSMKALMRERDILLEQQNKYAPIIAELKQKLKVLAESKKDSGTAKRDDSELEKQLSAIKLVRDGMATQINDLHTKIRQLEDEAAEAGYKLEALEKDAQEARAQQEELRKSLEAEKTASGHAEKIAELEAALNDARLKNAALEQQNSVAAENEEQFMGELSDLRSRLETITAERDLNAQAADEARTSLMAVQEEMGATQRQLAEGSKPADAALQEQMAEVARLKRELDARESQLTDNHQMDARFEKRRLEMIELTTQLENAHREIRLLSASLAETRLQAKLAAKTASPSNGKHKSGIVAPPIAEPHGKSTVAAMRRVFQTFSHDQNQLSLLKELEAHGQHIAEFSRDHGLPILHRVAIAFSTLLGDLYEMPDQISQGTMSTINQTIEFIGALINNPEIEHTAQLGDARIYVVDDDQNTCDTIVDALNTIGLQTHYALYSSSAMAELAGTRYDLIILDVNIPDLDGFELCSHIRNMALHAETPVFFITGHTSLENRVKSSLRGGNEFIGKPFNVQELALTALRSVISSQIHASGR